MAKLPALQFYPGDWRKDVGVQSLTFHDRGVWFEMLMLMHESEQRGYLMLGGVAMSDEILASLLHLPVGSLRETVATLVSRGVTCRDKRTNALINRRMIRDENVRAENGGRLARWRKLQKTQGNGNASETVDETPPQRQPSSSSSIFNSKGENVAEPLRPEMAAEGVMNTCRLSGTHLRVVITEQAKMAFDAGEELELWAENAWNAYRSYQDAKSKLEYQVGAQKFFGEGIYRDFEGWPWKPECKPRAKTPKAEFIPSHLL